MEDKIERPTFKGKTEGISLHQIQIHKPGSRRSASAIEGRRRYVQGYAQSSQGSDRTAIATCADTNLEDSACGEIKVCADHLNQLSILIDIVRCLIALPVAIPGVTHKNKPSFPCYKYLLWALLAPPST